ncbi:MAG: ATP-binding protein [Candidatus Saccharicenans sp.]|nr:ATP-binding protein [Candidatus Saccharicenans sp.]
MKQPRIFASWRKAPGSRLLLLGGSFFLLGLALLVASSFLLKSRAVQGETEILLGLRNGANLIRNEFSTLVNLLEKRQIQFQQNLASLKPEEIFAFFQKAGLETAVEGVSWLDKDLTPLLWLGNVADLRRLIKGWPESSGRFLQASFIIQDRASYFLVRLFPVDRDRYLALFELLAFQPQFQSAYLKEFIRLESVPGTGADINFWDYEQDTEALARFFSRTKDEYLSQQTEEVEIRTLYFPLRNEQEQILATVTLNSLQLQRQRFALPAFLRILAIALAIIAFILFTAWLYRSNLRSQRTRWLAWLLTAGGLAIIRIHLSILARNYPASGWKAFTPEKLGLDFPLGLAASPADLFISSLLFFILVYLTLRIFVAGFLNSFRLETSCAPDSRLPVIRGIILAVCSVISIVALSLFIREVVNNCNLNLLSFNLNLSSLLIYLSLFLVTSGLLFPVVLFSRQIVPGLHHQPLSLAACLLAGLLVLLFLSRQLIDFGLATVLILFLFWMLLTAVSTFNWRTWALSAACLLLISGLSYSLLREFTEAKTRKLTENVLVHLVASQKTWADMALRQSFSELQKRSRELFSYFRNPADPELARRLWNLTLLARLNWNSCLYLQSRDLKLLSSFGLNLPVFAEQTNDLPFSLNPTIEEQYLDILGREKHFLVGYQDFRDAEGQGGRLAIWVSLDPELLPFFYSANPYFELLRLNTLPSLQHFPVSLAMFDSQGHLLFAQNQPGFALPPDIQKKIKASSSGLWSRFRAGQDLFRAFFITLDDGNTYVFYRQEKSWRRQFTDFLKIFFLLSIFLALGLTPRVFKQGSWQISGRSFSFRVYLAFLVTGLVPLFFFIFFSQTVVSRLFADRFVQEATSRAYFARSILHDFISLQEQNEQPATEMPEDLVFWISNTLNNDVNLFKNGRLLSSSRREYFETGLLSEMLDGEAYFRLTYQNQPLVLSRKSFGRYSYQTLTVPYRYRQEVYFLNLPFPFEKQEISQARTELFEFFLFASIFFILLIGFLVATIKKMVVVPINQLIRATQEVGLGNLDVRVDHQPRDELRSLVDGFNTMVENLKAHEKELAELSQRVAWTEMARKVAHEIKNPLTPIQLSAEHILKVHADRHPDFDRVLQESISYIISEVENLRRIAGEFMTLARESGAIREKFDLKDLMLELLQPFRETLADRITFKLQESGHNFELMGDRGKMKVAIRNILINAIEAIKGPGLVQISLRDKGDELELVIKDTGCGIPQDVAAHIFEPYFSTKEKGTGLGLPICKRIVEEHEGTIRLESQPGQGTTVTITLPRRLQLQ